MCVVGFLADIFPSVNAPSEVRHLIGPIRAQPTKGLAHKGPAHEGPAHNVLAHEGLGGP